MAADFIRFYDCWEPMDLSATRFFALAEQLPHYPDSAVHLRLQREDASRQAAKDRLQQRTAQQPTPTRRGDNFVDPGEFRQKNRENFTSVKPDEHQSYLKRLQ